LYDIYVFMTKTTEGGKTDVSDVGRLDWDHVNHDFPITPSTANFGLPPGCLFNPDSAFCSQASAYNLLPSAAASAFAVASSDTLCSCHCHQ
jgi:hypothetical protein